MSCFKALYNAGDFEGIGAAIAEKCNESIHKLQNLDWDGISARVNQAVANFARACNGFIHAFDWMPPGT